MFTTPKQMGGKALSDDTKVLQLDNLLKRASVKFRLLNYDKYISDENIKIINNPSIFEANSKTFHPEGLFSETIFGPVTDLSRFTTFGWINLNTMLIHPVIYAEIVHRRKLYTGILSGKKYAKWDNKASDFVLADSDEKGANTGFKFFTQYLHRLTKSKTTSLKNKNKIALLKAYKDNLFMTKFLVMPAGLRDIKLSSSRLSQDDINKKYIQLISYTNGLSGHALSHDTIFDPIRYNIQNKIHDIFNAIYDMMKGKYGFLQEHYGKRKVALSTRNVASVEVSERKSVDDPLALTVNEAALPLMNAIKAFQPFVVKFIRKDLYGEVLGTGSNENIALTDMTSFDTAYVNVKPSEIRRYTDSSEVNKFINRFKHVGFRSSPVSILSDKGVSYCLLVVYIEGTDVFIGKNKQDLQELVEANGNTFDLKKVRALTWAEALYIAIQDIVKDKHVLVTRYPVTGEESIFSAKVVPLSTIEFMSAKIHFNSGITKDVLRYPKLDSSYRESIGVSSSRLAGLGADFDGDMLNCIGVWGDEGNKEIGSYLGSIHNLVSSDFTLNFDTTSDITKLVLFNLSK